jgi:hypothetical protein
MTDDRKATIEVDGAKVELTKTQTHCLIWLNAHGARGTYSKRSGRLVTRGSELCPYSREDTEAVVLSDLCEQEAMLGGGIQIKLKGQAAFTAAILSKVMTPEN